MQLQSSVAVAAATAALVLIVAPGTALAQDTRVEAPPPPKRLSAPPGTNPEAKFLADLLGIPESDAAERMDVIARVSSLASAAVAEDADAFGGVWVEHEPVFKVIVSFSDRDARQSFLDSIEPKLRRYVQIRHVRASQKQQQADLQQLFGVLRTSGKDFAVGFNPKNQKYEVNVDEGSDVGAIQRLIPQELKSLVTVRRGPVPKDAQTNVRAGDRVHAGWQVLTAAPVGAPVCTYGFAGVNVNNRPAISTAGHCSPTQPTVASIVDKSQLVTLPPFFVERWGDTYDFQLHEAVGLDPGYWVWFKNSQPVREYEAYVNTVPGYYAEGYFTVARSAPYAINNNEHFFDRPVCKSGQKTGFTCALVANSYTYGTAGGRPFSGMVRVNRSNQKVVAFTGDSGAPVFSPPDASYNTTALGLLKAVDLRTDANGNPLPCVTGTGFDCGFFYMPIDRIDHGGRFDLYTINGLVRP